MYWLGRQQFSPQQLGTKNFDITELFPFDFRKVTYEDESISLELPVSTADIQESQSNSNFDFPKAFQLVRENLGGNGKNTGEGITW